MGMRIGGSIEDRLRASFKLFDRNHDGVLSRAELSELICLVDYHKQYYDHLCSGRILNNAGKIRLRNKAHKQSIDLVNKIFQVADTDNSNSIDIEEFVTGFVSNQDLLAVLNLFSPGM